MPNKFFAAALTTAVLATTAAAQAATLVGLTENNQLVVIEGNRVVDRMPVIGTTTPLIGIDVRPADGLLYGIDSGSRIYKISIGNGGLASVVGELDKQFFGGSPKALVDFNPVADRLRVVGLNGTNFRINVETMKVEEDKPLNHADGKKPTVNTGAYSNPVKGAKETTLYDLDAEGTWYAQEPPNDGNLKLRGKLKLQDVAFDIAPGNLGYLITGKTLYTVTIPDYDLKKIGEVKGLDARLIDVAVLPN